MRRRLCVDQETAAGGKKNLPKKKKKELDEDISKKKLCLLLLENCLFCSRIVSWGRRNREEEWEASWVGFKREKTMGI